MVRLDDRDMELDGEDFPDRCLVAIQIGPSMLDDDLAGRIMSASSWLKNYEIDAVIKKIKEVEAFAQLIPPPASKRRRGSSSSGPAQTQCEDDTIPDISVDHTPDPSMEYLLPPYTGQFDSGAPPLDGTQQQQFA
ncbi:hypothetical protein Bca52824_064790 [Brassica carinata]|uniref:Uncharacterized protein n=1 Tax=Brassica carinata TaxID=52824 RepID=A0A8X7QKF3_BRACI|nr:hypothetical protein Bca52824_064790 [Brassica carinata]